ncbi:MAG TPA: hypothetical protein VFX98_12695 [Longimicrobiaceae bacterium]|nr:hypothetical protein [Longimicrobiaceae bacterium]
MSLRTIEHLGVTWNVWDVTPNDKPLFPVSRFAGEMQEGWLCFESLEEKRRLIPVPEGWMNWSEEELLARLAHAEPVKRRLGPDGLTRAHPDEEGAPR